MLADLRDSDRRFLGRYEVDPAALPASIPIAPPADHPDPAPRNHALFWDGALDVQSRLIRCPSCGCRDLFKRKDFPQGVGLASVLIAGLASILLFARGLPVWAVAVLAGTVAADTLFAFFIPQCLVCHRCRSEYRKTPIAPEIEGFDLAIGEKYRPIRTAHADDPSSV